MNNKYEYVVNTYKEQIALLSKKEKLADFFGVSVPYLQGYVEINIPNDLKFDSKQDAIECIEKIMKALDISTEDLRTEHRK